MSNAAISVQLYSLRETLPNHFEDIIARLAEIGFSAVEPYGRMPFEPAKAAAIFHRNGLRVDSAHFGLPLSDDSLKAAELYKMQRIVVPYLPAERFTTIDSIKQVCDELNTAHKIAKSAGFSLGYHNHWWEFKRIDERPSYEIMLENLEAEIFFEVDTYWTQTGGMDPAQVVRDLGERAPLLHIKDGQAADPQAPQVAVGEGVLDFHQIIEAGKPHTQWLIVELDRCATDMMTAIEKSYQYLTAEGLGHGKH